MIVSELNIYPVKSCQGIPIKQAEVIPTGFMGDRQMMLVTRSGKFLTQRQYPQLAKVQVKFTGENLTLSVADNSISPLTFTPTLAGVTIEVEIWSDRTTAIDQGDEVAQWFHAVLQLQPEKQCRLVRQSPDYIREINHKYALPTSQPVSFADGTPFLLTATASLQELNQRIAEIHQKSAYSLPMNRFRPNITIVTEQPFVEDNWKLIQIGEVRLLSIKPCSRCITTTIDQRLGIKDPLKEPLRTLGTFRQFGEQGVMFGEKMIPQTGGLIKLGDRVKILEVRGQK